MITVVVRSLKNRDALVPAVQNLGKVRVAHRLKPEHDAPLGAELRWTLDKGRGEAFIPEALKAWPATCTILATVMPDAAAPV